MSYLSTSCQLFHGPGAESQAYLAAKKFGKLAAFDSSSLKKEGARELVELMAHLPVGGGNHSVLVGPVDEIAPATSDVLLKTIEEFNPKGLRPFLWAWDLGGVSETLVSRCLLAYAPGKDDRGEAFLPMAEKLLAYYMAGDWVSLVEDLKEAKSDQDLLLRALVETLQVKLVVESPDPLYDSLWESLRDLFNGALITPARITSAFLEAHS